MACLGAQTHTNLCTALIITIKTHPNMHAYCMTCACAQVLKKKSTNTWLCVCTHRPENTFTRTCTLIHTFQRHRPKHRYIRMQVHTHAHNCANKQQKETHKMHLSMFDAHGLASTYRHASKLYRQESRISVIAKVQSPALLYPILASLAIISRP